MKTLLLGACVLLLANGCTISTELDSEGSPKYRRAVAGTGTNIAKRYTARDMPNVNTMDSDDVDRMLRGGKNVGKPGF